MRPSGAPQECTTHYYYYFYYYYYYCYYFYYYDYDYYSGASSCLSHKGGGKCRCPAPT